MQYYFSFLNHIQTYSHAYEVIIKSFIIISGLFAVYKFMKDWKRSFRSKFYEFRLSVFEEFLSSLAKIPYCQPNTDDYYMAKTDFNRLNISLLRIVENEDLRKSVERFTDKLIEFEDSIENPSLLVSRQSQLISEVQRISIICGNIIRKSWIEDVGKGYLERLGNL